MWIYSILAISKQWNLNIFMLWSKLKLFASHATFFCNQIIFILLVLFENTQWISDIKNVKGLDCIFQKSLYHLENHNHNIKPTLIKTIRIEIVS